MSIQLPQGFRISAVSCGLKSDPTKLDLTLLVSDGPAVASGVYTQNLVCGAPVVLNRERTPHDHARAVVVNAGIANACTGEQGLADARRMAAGAANAIDAAPEQVLVMSTGVIGELLPMDKIENGIIMAAERLSQDADSVQAAARAMMTTDTVPKLSGRELALGGRSVRILGIAKGSGMIGPNMATMLAVIATDARLTVDQADSWLAKAVDVSFNCVSVEGHTSTSDTVLLLGNGAAGGAPLDTSGTDADAFQKALGEVCEELALAIVDDGEGATHRITIDVRGCRTRAEAQTIAKTVANSALVKTAVTGADPNWGRIVSAAGYAGVSFDPARVGLSINGTDLYAAGAPVAFDSAAVSRSMAEGRIVVIELSFGEGSAGARFWTTDLTAEYVRINADYHT